jgi:hypothetical protein
LEDCVREGKGSAPIGWRGSVGTGKSGGGVREPEARAAGQKRRKG